MLEAIERAAQAAAAQIGLAALAGVVDSAGTHTPVRADCPDPGHAGPDASRAARLVARRTKTVRTLLGSIQTTRGYYHCPTCKRGSRRWTTGSAWPAPACPRV